jgi:hypothetical protein
VDGAIWLLSFNLAAADAKAHAAELELEREKTQALSDELQRARTDLEKLPQIRAAFASLEAGQSDCYMSCRYSDRCAEHKNTKDALTTAEAQTADLNTRLEDATKQLEELQKLTKSLGTAESSRCNTTHEWSYTKSIYRGKEGADASGR